ncbi:beta-1,3-glucanase family protein [Moorena producens JHB]|uniref:Beta-1,3-glucanase family protein n=1 Tax=Moorena producens (strain JHB) TaxID=1454205 RepID=A0A1D9FZ41_MOOP1|nr:beta-1,3-glucanase family protein [Moorena producens]AOY80603.1 beta-1,3-glucanase family protein [Moorena producens JHB]
MTNKTFHISGRIIGQKTRQGVAGLLVEAWDKDLIIDDLLGSTMTKADGTFQLSFDESYFRELFSDKQPDLYFKIYNQEELIKSTEDSVLWNVKEQESEVVIELEAVPPLENNPESKLTVTFINNSKVDNSAVYIGFVTGVSTVSIVNLKDSTPIKSVEDVDGAYPAKGNWYSLDQLPSGIGIKSFSGRIYVCYTKPWEVQRKGYEPAQAVNDPNLFLRYDKMELTFTGASADVANLTSIDYWSIPMSLNKLYEGKVVQTAKGLLPNVTTQEVYDALNKLTTPPVSGLDKTWPALVPGQWPDSPSDATFARIVGPSSYPPVEGIPVTPYDLFKDYLNYLLTKFGPDTIKGDGGVPNLGNGVIAHIVGDFAGVGPNVPSKGPQSKQTYTLEAIIDQDLNITLTGTVSGVTGNTTMLYKNVDLLNPSGIYGGNTPYCLNGASKLTYPLNDVYGWIGGDLFSGLNIGAVGSTAKSSEGIVGGLNSQLWFKLPISSFFANMQPNYQYYNQWAAALSKLSEAYNFPYSDRFAHVFVSLNPKDVDTLEIVLEDATVKMD